MLVGAARRSRRARPVTFCRRLAAVRSVRIGMAGLLDLVEAVS
jgi:hypothetical protein